jgi:hypothetical protein
MKKSKKNFQKSGIKHGKARWGKAFMNQRQTKRPIRQPRFLG